MKTQLFNKAGPAKPFISARGFSFIEVLVALFIFTIGILGIISLQGISLMSSDFSGNMSVARILAQDQLDRLQGTNFNATPLSACGSAFCHKDLGGGVNGFTANTIDRMGIAAASGRFRREWNVTDVATGVRQVSVRVSWTDSPGGATGVPAGSYNRRLEMRSIKINPVP